MARSMDARALLHVEDLHVSVNVDDASMPAVRGVSFDLAAGETLAIVGESGSGKSLTARAVLGLLPTGAAVSAGRIRFAGQELTHLSERQLQRIRGNDIAMVFQDPMTALDPTMSVGRQLIEPLRLHRRITRAAALEAAMRLLERVGIDNAERRLRHYPHQFSGGQRQRIALAIALICEPQILIADEPTTALDVTVQAQVLDLLADLRREEALSIVFITHDLGVVATIADRVAVMYAGRIVEIGTTREIFYDSRHPYTWGLLGSLPADKDGRLASIPGSPPDLRALPPGDAFAPRNRYALAIDREQEPPLFAVSATHQAATWLLADGAPAVDRPSTAGRREGNVS